MLLHLKRLVTVLSLFAAGVASSCAPSAPELSGELAPARLPRAELPPVHRSITFNWSYRDRDYSFRGEGVARIAPPDSARFDFFVGSGYGGGYALLIGDRLTTPRGDMVRNLLPPVPLLWASLGRLAVPPAADTAARVDGDTLRVDIGLDPAWRSTFVGDSLRGLALIDGGRIRQFVTRAPAGTVRYEHTRTGRRLDIDIVRVDTVAAYESRIWR
ncbi:MAG: hypothetical protein ACREON_06185 [Gemmatimonadaceae bacterium]